jgi:hypothetical protein
MTPEQFYWNNKLSNQQYMKEIRIRSLSWMLDCYDRGKIRRRTITQLIPEANLISLLREMEEVERYEDCSIIKQVLDRIYNPVQFNTKEVMSKKRQKEIIGLLTNTIEREKEKSGGGNSDIIEQLSKKLEQVKNHPKAK